MRRLIAVTRNTFLQTLRQPIYGRIVLITLGAFALAPSMTGWTLDDDNKLLRDLGLSTLLVQGLFLAAYGAAGVISQEIEDKTVLSVVAKPISRGTFMLGKYLGVLLALLVAHYIGMLAFVMTLRHGVLQTAADKSDPTVLIAGPGVMLVVMITAGVLNYLFEWKFYSTTVVLGLIGLTISMFFLLFVDKNFSIRTYELTQDVPGLPADLANPEKSFKGIIRYRDESEIGTPEKKGKLVRSEWMGPISDSDRAYLIGLSYDEQFQKCVNYLVVESRKLVTTQILKAALLLIAVLAVLTSFAVATSTRLSTEWTLLLTIVMLGIGLVGDHFLTPRLGTSEWWSPLASLAYMLVPNIQFFWLIDAIAEDRVIPTTYLLNAFGYGFVLSFGILAIGAAMFETREVG